MTGFPGIARAKLLVSKYGPALAVALAIVAVLALGIASWNYTHPPTTTVTDHTNKQTIQSTLQTSAIVTGESALYREGARIENQPVYFVDATPTLTLTVQTSVPDEQAVQVDQQIHLVMRASHDGEVFWQQTRVLEQEETTTSNGTVTTSTELNVSQLNNQVAPVRAELGSAGSLAVFVTVKASYETNQYSGSLSGKTPVQISGRTYSVEPLTFDTTESTPKARTIVLPTREASAYTIPAGIGVTALLGAGLITGLYRRSEHWNGIEGQIHRSRYADWISAGTLSTEIGDQYVPVASLEDLVDIGIDTNNRVIFDRDRDIYAVIDGRMVYYWGEERTWEGQMENPTNIDQSEDVGDDEESPSTDDRPT